MSLPHPIDRLVAKLGRQSPLSAEDRAALRAVSHRSRALAPNELLVQEGEPPLFCAGLISGFAHRLKSTIGGGRQILALHVPGDALDLQNLYLDLSDHSVRALTRAEVVTLSRRELQRLAEERPAIARAITKDTMIEASMLREWMLNIGRRNARARVAHLLCEFAVRMDAAVGPASGSYVLPMSQEQIGDATGLTPVHVNRTLRLLADEGLIDRRRRDILFPDWRALRDVAEFDPRYLHAPVAGAESPAEGASGQPQMADPA